MFPDPIQRPPKWWAPRLSPFWFRVSRPYRRWRLRHEDKIIQIEVRGVEHLEQALREGHGILITPNHPGPGDADVMCYLADRAHRPFYFMAGWQVFLRSPAVVRFILRMHGCFSVDREGTGLRAFRQAVEILSTRSHPLVIFPEGEVYHLGERITPFHQGPAAIALSAAKRGNRTVAIVPTAIKYHYLEDPAPELVRTMDRLEAEMFWRPRPDLSLVERIYRLGEVLIAIKEIEYHGSTSSGPLNERIASLVTVILSQLEDRYGLPSPAVSIPERVKSVRQQILQRTEELSEEDPGRAELEHDMGEIFHVLQMFSYPGDYVRSSPSVERIAETLSKLEEDIMEVRAHTPNAARRAVVTLGRPIEVVSTSADSQNAEELTHLLETQVQELLDSILPPPNRDFGDSESLSVIQTRQNGEEPNG